MIYVIMNAHWQTTTFELPHLSKGINWHVAVNTGMSAPEDIHPLGKEPTLATQHEILVGARSVVILVGR